MFKFVNIASDNAGGRIRVAYSNHDFSPSEILESITHRKLPAIRYAISQPFYFAIYNGNEDPALPQSGVACLFFAYARAESATRTSGMLLLLKLMFDVASCRDVLVYTWFIILYKSAC